MRRKDREVSEMKEILKIMDNCHVCRVAFQDEQGLMIVPLNFGYTYQNHQFTLFFHSAKEGRKVKAFKADPKVCFEMDCGHELVEGALPCTYTYYYQSVVGEGLIKEVEDVQTKKEALACLMKHQTQQDFVFTDQMAEGVLIYALSVIQISAKAHQQH